MTRKRKIEFTLFALGFILTGVSSIILSINYNYLFLLGLPLSGFLGMCALITKHRK